MHWSQKGKLVAAQPNGTTPLGWLPAEACATGPQPNLYMHVSQVEKDDEDDKEKKDKKEGGKK